MNSLVEMAEICHKQRAATVRQHRAALTTNEHGAFDMAKPIPTQIPDDVKARFWAKVDVRGPDACWEWLSTKIGKGYGRVRIGGVGQYPAHRIALWLSGAPIATDQVIDYLCRNPSCVNPAHLEAVSNRENTLRGVAGVHRVLERVSVTHCKRGHLMSPDNLRPRKDGARDCRACFNMLARERVASRRGGKGHG